MNRNKNKDYMLFGYNPLYFCFYFIFGTMALLLQTCQAIRTGKYGLFYRDVLYLAGWPRDLETRIKCPDINILLTNGAIWQG